MERMRRSWRCVSLRAHEREHEISMRSEARKDSQKLEREQGRHLDWAHASILQMRIAFKRTRRSERSAAA